MPEHQSGDVRESNAALIGAQIRRMREARRMSAAELAREAGISKGTLSTLEAGLGNPTIDTLSAIAVTLRLPLGDIILPASPPKPVVRTGTREPDYSKQELLHRMGAGVLTEVWRIRIHEAGQRIESPPHAPGTSEHIYVAHGELTAGPVDAPNAVTTGDFLIFGADVPHFYQASTDNADAICVMTYPATGW
ncbi:helix-turn-helix domain-containing protein [Amycolatopsis sp. H20-H5]|uniref:helix-turn-helix domain-containing protein n=1 Tax=Amycolatopsis sp. H20-H5 TaxID=3046309 RepID=UPI002DBAB3DC|nr:XRE family transcriptional regulator [Amycolatopsis sp. H20-H5]MEC3980500.1 XRE family transcriptional regulator [Amycolatopsis sp. H20-H5]